MSPQQFIEYWRRSYGETPLVGHVLRECFPQRWLRIHNLPDSKRYAETVDEYRELLGRQNRVFGDLVGEARPCELVFGYYGEEERLPEQVLAALRHLRPVYLTTLSPGQSGLVEEHALWKASVIWRQNGFDTILRAVADDVLETPLILSAERACILAPYDGGVDIVVESAALRGELARRYVSWLSKGPAGL